MTPLLVTLVASPLFTADLQAVVLKTEPGRSARAKLERAVERASADAAARRDRLLARRSELESEAFEAERQRLNRRVEETEARLAAREQALLEPILARLDALVAEVEASTGGRVVDVARRRVAGQPAACELTDALAARFVEGEVSISEARAEQCTPEEAVARVNAGRAVKGTPTAREIVAARDADRKRLRVALAALGDAGGDPQRARRIRAQIEARDEAARAALEAAVHRAMNALARRHPGTVWLAVDSPRLANLDGVCDGTPHVRRLLGGSGGASGCALGDDR
jgi:hypothetical protein